MRGRSTGWRAAALACVAGLAVVAACGQTYLDAVVGQGGSGPGPPANDAACEADLVLCDGRCTSLADDPASCGACDRACEPRSVCSAGECVALCSGGLSDCSGSCVDPGTSPDNCGGCGIVCDAEERCVDGACVCAAGFANCNGDTTCSTNTQTDPNDCGGCGTVCHAEERCVNGACACPAGSASCNGDTTCWTNTQTNPNNCGGCGIACGAKERCVNGACTCPAGSASCDGDTTCWTNTQTNPNDCGGCGVVCPGGGTCVAGVCHAVEVCLSAATNPATGQRCPIFAPCQTFSDCGTAVDCNDWSCVGGTCGLSGEPLCQSATTNGGHCNADLVLTQNLTPPTPKTFVPPDGVNARTLESLAFTIKNNTPQALYFDSLPIALDAQSTNGGLALPSDVTEVQVWSHALDEYQGVGLELCAEAPSTIAGDGGVLEPCAFDSNAWIPALQSRTFYVYLYFAANVTFIDGSEYRIVIPSEAGFSFKVGGTNATFTGSTCGVSGPWNGVWVTAQAP